MTGTSLPEQLLRPAPDAARTLVVKRYPGAYNTTREAPNLGDTSEVHRPACHIGSRNRVAEDGLGSAVSGPCRRTPPPSRVRGIAAVRVTGAAASRCRVRPTALRPVRLAPCVLCLPCCALRPAPVPCAAAVCLSAAHGPLATTWVMPLMPPLPLMSP